MTADYSFDSQLQAAASKVVEANGGKNLGAVRVPLSTSDKKYPSMLQAGYYSATTTYLNAIKSAGTTDGDMVMLQLKKMKIDDMFTKNGYIRADGLMIHDMYVMQVKSPQESKYA